MKKLESLGRKLSREEQKRIIGGNVILCGGNGNYAERCGCIKSDGTDVGPFYCCHSEESTCISSNCGSNYIGYLCSKVTG